MVQSSCHEKLLFYLETQLLKVSNVWCYFSLQLAVQFRGSSVVHCIHACECHQTGAYSCYI